MKWNNRPHTDRGPRLLQPPETTAGCQSDERGEEFVVSVVTLTLQLNLPLVPLAGFIITGVTEAAQAEGKLVVLESHTASHTGTGIGPPVRGTHRDKAVRTTTGKTWRRTWGEAGREMTVRMTGESIDGIKCDGMNTQDRMIQ